MQLREKENYFALAMEYFLPQGYSINMSKTSLSQNKV